MDSTPTESKPPPKFDPQPESVETPRIGLALAVAIHLGAAAIIGIVSVTQNVDAFGGGVSCGILFAQISLCAGYAAMGTGDTLRRVAASLALAAVSTLVLARLFLHSGMGYLAVFTAVPVFAMLLWLTLQLPGWIYRVRSGWRVATQFDPPDNLAAVQFSLKGMLVATTGLAALLCVGRLLFATWSPDGLSSRSHDTEMILFFCGAVLFSTFAAGSQAAVMLGERGFVAASLLGIAVAVVIGLAWLIAMGLIFGNMPDGDSFPTMLVVNYVSYQTLQLLLLRAFGYRLRKSSAAECAMWLEPGSGESVKEVRIVE